MEHVLIRIQFFCTTLVPKVGSNFQPTAPSALGLHLNRESLTCIYKCQRRYFTAKQKCRGE